jgi:hypothetical protein
MTDRRALLKECVDRPGTANIEMPHSAPAAVAQRRRFGTHGPADSRAIAAGCSLRPLEVVKAAWRSPERRQGEPP